MNTVVETKAEIAQMGMDASEMLGSILKAIKNEAEYNWNNGGNFKASAFLNIKSLAMTGSYIADDFNNVLDCLREDIEDEEKAAST